MKAIVFAMTVLAAAATAAPGRAAESTGIVAIFEQYEAIRRALIAGTTDGIAPCARAIATLAENLSARPASIGPDAAVRIEALLPQIEAAATTLAATKSVSAAREAFYALSKPLVIVQSAIVGDRPIVVYCPMEKRSWLQPDEPIGNPYAPSMLRCGKVVAR